MRITTISFSRETHRQQQQQQHTISTILFKISFQNVVSFLADSRVSCDKASSKSGNEEWGRGYVGMWECACRVRLRTDCVPWWGAVDVVRSCLLWVCRNLLLTDPFTFFRHYFVNVVGTAIWNSVEVQRTISRQQSDAAAVSRLGSSWTISISIVIILILSFMTAAAAISLFLILFILFGVPFFHSLVLLFWCTFQ